VPARAVLDELIRVGTVVRKDNIVRMKQKGYIPHESTKDMLDILGDSCTDLLETIDHNISSEQDQSRLQLNVVYDNLPQEALEEFHRLADKKSMELLKELDKYLAKNDRDTSPKVKGNGTFRAGLGVYLIEQNLSDDE